MKRPASSASASVRTRLLERARREGVDHQSLLVRFANERLLARLGNSPHRERFVLKGAALFTLWSGSPHRATRDLDLPGFGDPDGERLLGIFCEILQGDAGDGVEFETGSMVVESIRHEQAYGGQRLQLWAWIGSARVRLQVDVGYGDAITPEAVEVAFPALIHFDPPRLRAYPPETVVAEKLEAAVRLGVANSRMKDLYDLATISGLFEFDGDLLVRALRTTFDRRAAPLPLGEPMAWTDAFVDDSVKLTQWAGFTRKAGLAGALSLAETMCAVRRFLAEPLQRAATVPDDWNARWSCERGWLPAAPSGGKT